jgi:hypothetical protein
MRAQLPALQAHPCPIATTCPLLPHHRLSALAPSPPVRTCPVANHQPLQGLTDALIANGQQSKAVKKLTQLRDGLALAPPTPAPAAAAADAAGPASSSGRAPRPLDPVAVQLLLGKAYAGWRGHDPDALAAYDALIKSAPEDFRGYLAKGVFLKERGRRGDAERMFLQVPGGERDAGAGRGGEGPAARLAAGAGGARRAAARGRCRRGALVP